MKNYRVYLKNGTEIKIKADHYRFTDDRYAVQFYKSATEAMLDIFVFAGEVAAIIPDKINKGHDQSNQDEQS